jgi:predicted GTPase
MKTGRTEQSLKALREALTSLPMDHALSEARNFIRLAVDRIENVEKKRHRREENSLNLGSVPAVVGNHGPGSLDLIDRMIAEEQKKLGSNKPQKPLDGELSTLFD